MEFTSAAKGESGMCIEGDASLMQFHVEGNSYSRVTSVLCGMVAVTVACCADHLLRVLCCAANAVLCYECCAWPTFCYDRLHNRLVSLRAPVDGLYNVGCQSLAAFPRVVFDRKVALDFFALGENILPDRSVKQTNQAVVRLACASHLVWGRGRGGCKHGSVGYLSRGHRCRNEAQHPVSALSRHTDLRCGWVDRRALSPTPPSSLSRSRNSTRSTCSMNSSSIGLSLSWAA